MEKLYWETDVGLPEGRHLEPLTEPVVDDEPAVQTFERAMVTLGLEPGTHARFRITVERVGDIKGL